MAQRRGTADRAGVTGSTPARYGVALNGRDSDGRVVVVPVCARSLSPA